MTGIIRRSISTVFGVGPTIKDTEDYRKRKENGEFPGRKLELDAEDLASISSIEEITPIKKRKLSLEEITEKLLLLPLTKESFNNINLFAQKAIESELEIDRVVRLSETEEGAVLYIFGGTPNIKGTHPRHVSITVDNEDKGICICMSSYKCLDDYEIFEISLDQIDKALVRISKFIENSME